MKEPALCEFRSRQAAGLAFALGLLLLALMSATMSLAAPGDVTEVGSGQVLWSVDGVPLSSANKNQQWPDIVSDGQGGAIVVWQDYRDATSLNGPTDIYAQRVYSEGTPAWTPDGVPLSLATDSQMRPQIVDDRVGGAVITWVDRRNGNADVYAQRVYSNGTTAWATDGVSLCTAENDQYGPVIISDGMNGAIVAWYDHRDGDADVYAQRVYSDGTTAWVAGGISLTVSVDDQRGTAITSDGAGGAIVAWQGGCSGIPGICAQRVYPDGTTAWMPDGVWLGGNLSDLTQITSDGDGGAIVVWREDYTDIFAQRVLSNGTVAWLPSGIAVVTAAGGQLNPTIAVDGSGGALVAWQDERDRGSSLPLVYAQRIYSDGTPAWPVDGIRITIGESSPQWHPDIAEDGEHGTLITWGGVDANAQRLRPDGTLAWGPNGLSVCAADYGQEFPRLVNQGTGGAIIAWQDNRRWYKVANLDIYVQRVTEMTHYLYLPLVTKET